VERVKCNKCLAIYEDDEHIAKVHRDYHDFGLSNCPNIYCSGNMQFECMEVWSAEDIVQHYLEKNRK